MDEGHGKLTVMISQMIGNQAEMIGNQAENKTMIQDLKNENQKLMQENETLAKKLESKLQFNNILTEEKVHLPYVESDLAVKIAK